MKSDTLDKAKICNRQFQTAFTRESDTEIPSECTSPFTNISEITVDPLEQVQPAKYLGLSITDDFDWGQHISEMSSTTTKTMGFLRRNLAFAHRHTKEGAYKTLALLQLERAAPIRHPYYET